MASALVASRTARAQAGGLGSGSDAAALAVVATGAIVGGGIVLSGLVTDGILITRLARDGVAPRGVAIAGTALWSVTTVAAGAATIFFANEVGNGIPNAQALAIAGGALALSAGSLGLSVFALTRPEPPRASGAAPRTHRAAATMPAFVVAPVFASARGGVDVGATLAMRW